MSSSLLSLVLLDNPATPDMSAVSEILHTRHPELAREPRDDAPVWQAQANSPLIRCGNALVAVMSMPAPIPHDEGLWARAASTWPESKAVAARHRGHLIVSMLGKGEQPLQAARVTTAVIGALIATMPECCGVAWASQVARPADLWLEASRDAFAPYPDYPFRLWLDILPFRSGAKIGAVTMGLSAFVGREIEFVTGQLTLSALFDKVTGLAAYLIEHGSIVKDGDTIGASASESIQVRYKNSDAFGRLPVFYCTDDSV